MLVIGEIIQELLKAHEAKKDVNLNRMKSLVASKYGLDSSPRLVDIIAAVPQDAKKILLPKLRAKPIRTASGVSRTCLHKAYYSFQLFQSRSPWSPSCASRIVVRTSI